ncbi:MAG: hypothetical protein V3U37_04620 [Nitrospinaceae bacterium]
MNTNSTGTKWMMWVNRWFRITCRDTTPLISELIDQTIPLGKRLRVRIQLGVCGVCSLYKKQLEIIQALARKLGSEAAPIQKEMVLSEQAKAKIKDALKQSN